MQLAVCGAGKAVDPFPQDSTDKATMQKILRSPVTMKKKITNSKTFGVPLKELARGPAGEVRIPVFIKKICDFIQMHGIGHEGIFRINGSTRVVDKMKALIDKTGNTDFEEAGDVMAIASLLKLYLRELPDPVMTETLHLRFVNAQLAFQSKPEECVTQLKNLINSLPEEHHVVLHYLIRFLVMVSQYEVTNKMNSMALAIVFGPNLFRCSQGLEGLREQGVTNIIVRTMIEEYDTLFKTDGNDDEGASPSPPRPAAPPVGSKCIQVLATTSMRSPPVRPAPYHEYVRQKDLTKRMDPDKDINSNLYTNADKEDLKQSEDRDLLSPGDVVGIEDRAFSPFNLDSETGTSTAPSPVNNDVVSELVDKTIQETVSQHLFGQSPSTDREESLMSPTPEVPVPSPRRRRHKKFEDLDEGKDAVSGRDSPDCQSSSSIEEVFPSVSDCIRSLSSSSAGPESASKSPQSSPKVKRKHPPSSKAFEMFETRGIIIGPEQKESPKAKKKQPSNSVIDQLIAEPFDSSLSRRKAPDPPVRVPRAKSKLVKTRESLASVSAKSTSSRSHSPRSHSPRSSSPNSGSPRSKSPKSDTPIVKPLSSRFSEETKHSYLPPSVSSLKTVETLFDDLSSSQPTLRSLTAGRIAPPRNRRSPSKRKTTSPQSKPAVNTEEIGRPITEQLSIIIPDSAMSQPPDTLTPPDTPQPKPRRKYQAFAEGSSLRLYQSTDQCLSDGLEALMNGQGVGVGSPPRSPMRRENAIPPLDLTSLHEHTDGEEPIPAWKARHHFDDGSEEAMLSPRSLKLQTIAHHFDSPEAPLSPRARDTPFNFSISHNTDVPPSPPSTQSLLMGVSKRTDNLQLEVDLTNIKQLTKQIRSFKRKIRQYEEEFEDEHGYKPSHSHKTSQPQIKKMMGELKRASKQLKEAKEIAAKAKVSLSSTVPAQTSSIRNLSRQFKEISTMSSLEVALHEAEARLQEKRDELDRPEDMNAMSKDEVQEEKTAIQKALLQMENKFGRPTSRESKQLMKPLYDRYRNIKKLLVRLDLRQVEDGQPLDLQTINEHEETKEFQPKQMGQIHSIYRDTGEDTKGEIPTTDFTVTQEFKDTISVDLEDSYPSPAESRRNSAGGESLATVNDPASNLHEASLSELLAQQNQSRDNKKRLRKVLKDFEDKFFAESGRHVQKEDRVPMETEYYEYKHVKKHLKLLEALVAKHKIQGSLLDVEGIMAKPLAEL